MHLDQDLDLATITGTTGLRRGEGNGRAGAGAGQGRGQVVTSAASMRRWIRCCKDRQRATEGEEEQEMMQIQMLMLTSGMVMEEGMRARRVRAVQTPTMISAASVRPWATCCSRHHDTIEAELD